MRVALLHWHRVALGLLLVLAACAPAYTVRFESTARSAPEVLSATLYRPEGTGPFPAVVLLHTCGGLEPHVFSWARWLTGEGYLALVVDSFSAPGRSRNVCGTERNPTVREVAQDALGALAYLRTQPFADPERIAVMGFSYGANAALVAGMTYGPGRFRGAVAFYPGCGFPPAAINIPFLLLLGGADTETPPALCVEKARLLNDINQPVSWKVYPQATHGFDKAELGSRTAFGGYRYDAAATWDAEKEVRAFLARHLRQAP